MPTHCSDWWVLIFWLPDLHQEGIAHNNKAGKLCSKRRPSKRQFRQPQKTAASKELHAAAAAAADSCLQGCYPDAPLHLDHQDALQARFRTCAHSLVTWPRVYHVLLAQAAPQLWLCDFCNLSTLFYLPMCF